MATSLEQLTDLLTKDWLPYEVNTIAETLWVFREHPTPASEQKVMGMKIRPFRLVYQETEQELSELPNPSNIDELLKRAAEGNEESQKEIDRFADIAEDEHDRGTTLKQYCQSKTLEELLLDQECRHMAEKADKIVLKLNQEVKAVKEKIVAAENMETKKAVAVEFYKKFKSQAFIREFLSELRPITPEREIRVIH